MLPVLLELTETLYDKHFVRVLITVESFARDTKLTARSVLIMNARKFDGRTFRLLTTDEYSRMAGRAGRRGKDSRGSVVLMLSHKVLVNEKQMEKVVRGELAPVRSQLNRLSFRMALSMAGMSTREAESMLAETLHYYQAEGEVPRLREGEF